MDEYMELLAMIADEIRRSGRHNLVQPLLNVIDNQWTAQSSDTRLTSLSTIVHWCADQTPPTKTEMLTLLALVARSYKNQPIDEFTPRRQDELGVLNWLPESASDE